MIIYTCLFGDYEELKQPKVITPGWEYVCLTDQPLKPDVWQIEHMPLSNEGAQRTARYCKIMGCFMLGGQHSIYIDASFTINCDLNEWWLRFEPSMTCIKHPVYDCVYEEADACIKAGRGNREEITKQIELYRRLGIPRNNGLIQSGLLMREHSKQVYNFCRLWHEGLISSRDQIAFALAAYKMPIHHTFEWDYRTATEFIYTKHFKYRK